MQNLTAWKAFLEKHRLGEPKLKGATYDSRVFAKLPNVYLLRPGSPDLTPAATGLRQTETDALEELAELMAGARVIRSGPEVSTLEVQAPERFLPTIDPSAAMEKSHALETLFAMVSRRVLHGATKNNDPARRHLTTECSMGAESYSPTHFVNALDRALGSYDKQLEHKQREVKRLRKQRDAARKVVSDVAVAIGPTGPGPLPEQARLVKAKADALDRLAKHLHGTAGTADWPRAPHDTDLPVPQYEPERFAGTVLESLADKAEQRAVVSALRGRLAEIAEVLGLSTEDPASDVLTYAKETVEAMRHASFDVDVGAPEAIRQLLAKRIEHSEVHAFLTGNLHRPRQGSLRDDVAWAMADIGKKLEAAQAQLNDWKRLVQPLLEHRRKGQDNDLLADMVSRRASEFERLLSGYGGNSDVGADLAPVDMVIHCPRCGLQHVDAPEEGTDWDNPPHRSHLCAHCGLIWRVADVPTNGVLAPQTRGYRDIWPPENGPTNQPEYWKEQYDKLVHEQLELLHQHNHGDTEEDFVPFVERLAARAMAAETAIKAIWRTVERYKGPPTVRGAFDAEDVVSGVKTTLHVYSKTTVAEATASSRQSAARMMWIKAQRVRALMERVEDDHAHMCRENCDYPTHELGALLKELVQEWLELATQNDERCKMSTSKVDPTVAADPTRAGVELAAQMRGDATETKGGDTHERQRDSRDSESASQVEAPPAREVGGDAAEAEERRLLAKEVKRARRKHGLSTQGRLEIPRVGLVAVPAENWVELQTGESLREGGTPDAVTLLDTPALLALRDWSTEWIGDGDPRAEELDALATRQQKTIDEGRRRERFLRGAVEAMKPAWKAVVAYVEEEGRERVVNDLFDAVQAHRGRIAHALAQLDDLSPGEPMDFNLDLNGFAKDVERGLKRLKKQRGWDELSVDEGSVQRWLTSNLSPTAEAVTFRDVLAYVYMAFDALCRGELLPTLGGAGHLVDGEFQSDKYPSCPRGKVPLSTKDPLAQDLLWEYAERRRSEDASFSHDLQLALDRAGYERNQSPVPLWRTGRRMPRNVYAGDEAVCQTHLESDARTMVDAVNLVRTGCLVSVVRPALFTFQSFDDWKKRGKELYAEHYVRLDNTLALDARGRPCMVGAHFRRAEEEGAYPVSVYALTGEPREGGR